MKRFFKTVVSLLLTAVLAFSLTGCGLREAVAKTVSEILEQEPITDRFITGTIDSEACKYTNRSLDLVIDLDEENKLLIVQYIDVAQSDGTIITQLYHVDEFGMLVDYYLKLESSSTVKTTTITLTKK